MDELPYIDDPKILKQEISMLIADRENNKVKQKRNYSLTVDERHQIWQKTDGKCHICGRSVDKSHFEADHIKNHSGGGGNTIDNFLATCRTCNNYRWHYSPEEIQWILKLGVWAKTKIDHGDAIGNLIADNFTKKERERENRRKNPRESLL